MPTQPVPAPQTGATKADICVLRAAGTQRRGRNPALCGHGKTQGVSLSDRVLRTSEV